MPKLMIPGPTEVSEQARQKMALPTRPHYGTQWSAFYFQVVDKLKKVFQTQNDLFVLAATSSGAMELSVSHAVEPGDKILICNNGFFGDRFEDMAKHYGIVTVTTRSEYGQPIRGEQVREAIKKDPDIKALAIVHNESSTAVESPLAEITSVAQEYGVLTIVDCVSSMGGVDIPTDKLGIDFCISGSQKCFGSPAGLGFVSVSDKAWKTIESRKTQVPSWYLNLITLRDYQKQWTNWHPEGPNTAPVALYLALNQALDEIFAEGLPARFARHTLVRDAFREAIKAMGLKLFVGDDWASRTLTGLCLPDGIDGEAVRNKIESKHDILLAGGLGATANSIIRVGHLSMTATPEYIVPTLMALETELAAAGAKINKGASVEAFVRKYGA
ncbi:alanine--glyoxylate aminotransferase family protein [bacterium]|nr:alanine--glyoxylate aminotransferase family protein [bacterium]